MNALAAAWDRFWFAEGSTLALGVFRIWFALVMFFEVGTSFALQQNAIEGGFHLSYTSLVPPLSEGLYRALHWLQYPAWVFLALGVFPRSACLALVVLQGWPFLADPLAYRNHTYLALLVTCLLFVSPCGRSLALGPIRPRAQEPPRAPVTAQRLIQFQVAAMYFWSGVNKLQAGFLSGSVMAYAIGEAFLPKGLSGAFLARLEPATSERILAWASTPAAMAPAAWATALLELSLPFALWWRRTRTAAILAGVVFHAVIGVAMDIGTFGLIAVGSYVLFLDPDTVERWAHWRKPWDTRRSKRTSTAGSSPSR